MKLSRMLWGCLFSTHVMAVGLGDSVNNEGEENVIIQGNTGSIDIKNGYSIEQHQEILEKEKEELEKRLQDLHDAKNETLELQKKHLKQEIQQLKKKLSSQQSLQKSYEEKKKQQEKVRDDSYLKEYIASDLSALEESKISTSSMKGLIPSPIPNQSISVKARISPDQSEYYEYDTLRMHMTLSEDAYVMEFVHSSGDESYLIYPNQYDVLTRVKKNQEYTVGHDGEDYELVVGEPFGRDQIQIIATTDKKRYLRLLRSLVLTANQINAYNKNDLVAKTKGILIQAKKDKSSNFKWGEALLEINTVKR